VYIEKTILLKYIEIKLDTDEKIIMLVKIIMWNTETHDNNTAKIKLIFNIS